VLYGTIQPAKYGLQKKREVYEIKMKNLMQRFIQYLKYRTECFDDHFPCQKKKDCDRQNVWNWLKKMYLRYQNISVDRMRFMMFMIGGGCAQVNRAF
jgi:hypothetical protein